MSQRLFFRLWLLGFFLLSFSLIGIVNIRAAEPAFNIALAKTYTLTPEPNYKYCTDPGDLVQLTDGETTAEHFWTQPGTVGWERTPFAAITIDLERVEPISGVEMTSAAGQAGVAWPLAVFIQTSDDGETFHEVGELLSLDREAHGPLPEGYAIRCFSTNALATRGRFVRLVLIASGSYLFVDEVRVFRGNDALLQGPSTGTLVSNDPAKFVEQTRMRLALHRRYAADLANLRKLIAEASLAATVRENLTARLAGIEKKIAAAFASKAPPFDASGEGFRAILPIGPLHGEIFQVQAALWDALGLGFQSVPVSPWDKAVLIGMPSEKNSEPRSSIEVHAMQGEYRAAAFNLYNSSQEPLELSLRIEGIPAATELTVHDVPWTDTNRFDPVLAALPELAPRNGTYAITVLPGLPKQLYVTFRPNNLTPGKYAGAFVLETAEKKPFDSIPLTLHVWPMRFPEKTSLLLGGWSYTDGEGAYSINPKNRDSFLKHLQERFVNAPWARPLVVMSFEIDKATKTVTLDTKEMDAWLKQWPTAREYCIFLSVPATIKDVKHDAPEFEALVGAWTNAWVKHWREKGIEPDRINLLVADEPGLDFDLSPMYAWARAIRKAEPRLRLWTDPVYKDPTKAPTEIFEVNDVICPNRPQWLENRAGFDTFYFDWQRKGKTLQLYSCSGPVRLLDPYSYFRLQPWECARIDGTGSFYWAFGDGAGFSSWNEYAATRDMYTPLFIDPAEPTVIAGKQMEAIREGIEDYETIRMLQEAIKRRKAKGKPTAEAETVLRESIESVLYAEGADKIFWKEPKDRTLADQARVRILEAIRQLEE